MYNQIVFDLSKMRNKLIIQATRFVERTSFSYGAFDLITRGVKSGKLYYDYEYFAFAKSTKTMLAIRSLQKQGLNEDALILVRSMFENYISCRFFNEHPEKLADFVLNPVMLSKAFYNFCEGEIIDRDGNVVGTRIDPTGLKLGMDKRYYSHFYDYLCRYAHCNFGVVHDYQEPDLTFSIKKSNNTLDSLLFTVFVFTKIFELVVLWENEDHFNDRTKTECYRLVKDAIHLLEEAFDIMMGDLNSQFAFDAKRKKKMLKDMKKSLEEELGDMKKT